MVSKENNILDLIGNTPLVPINRLNPNKKVQILAKLEYFNPGGSIKDRPALQMILDAEEKGELTKDKIILEASSGNTGIGLAMVAAVKGYRIMIVLSEAASEERKQILRGMGAELKLTPAHLGTDGAIEYVYNLFREEPEKYWLADQFNNESNWMAHYNGTAMEIWEQTNGELNAIVATMGTTGTLMGLSRRFKELNPDVQIIGMEPYLGHKIQGLKNMKEAYTPGIYDKSRTDRIIRIEDEEAYQTTRLLARKEGIFVGMSSGAAMATAIRLAKEMDEGRIVVIFPDSGERYLSTILFEDKKRSGQFLYNTLTKKKEEFIPIDKNNVRIYTCGPTLSNLVNVGQCRRFIFSDLLRRYMEFKGFNVTHLMNVTDIDDRTIEGANKEGLSLKIFTEKYYDEFLKDLDTLNIKRANDYPKASEYVEEMIRITQKLLEKGYAYEKFKSIYFDIYRFKDYGRLSRIDLKKIKIGKTVDLEQYEKEDPKDFTLLKRSTLSELKKGIFYQTQWGNIRPSWHLECPAMSMKHFGETYDIHTSGVDLIFPHHENSIAIAQAVTGKAPVNYWLHNELVMIDGKKSSNISENIYTVRKILEKGYTGREIRYWLISSHYRKPISFSWKKLDMAKRTISNMDKFILKLHYCKSGTQNPEIDQIVYDLKYNFTEAMDDDLNIAPALAALFQFTGKINRIMDKNGLNFEDKKKIQTGLEGINSVVGFINLEDQRSDDSIEVMIKERETARTTGDFKTADRIRKELETDFDIEIIDTKEGTVWRKKV